MRFLTGCLMWIGGLTLAFLGYIIFVLVPEVERDAAQSGEPVKQVPKASEPMQLVVKDLAIEVRFQSADFYEAGRQYRGRVYLQALETGSARERALLVSNFAKQVADRKDLDFVDVILSARGTLHEDQNIHLAKADYARHLQRVPFMDVPWKIVATDVKISDEQIRVANAWQENRGAFLEADGLLNEELFKPYLAQRLNLPEERISLVWTFLNTEYKFEHRTMTDGQLAVLKKILQEK